MNRASLTVWHRFNHWFRSLDDARALLFGYGSYCLLGALILCLPFCHESHLDASLFDHFFTAISAVSTTGLTTIPTADSYTWFGEVVILLLIQLGGIGYMTVGSFLVLTISGKLPAWRKRISSAAIATPQDFDRVRFVRQVVTFTLSVEAVGALLLYFFVFSTASVETPMWQAVFHSVSAFCTAGFALFSDSFERFRGDGALNIIITALSVLGSIGFIVMADAWRSITSRKLTATFTTKIILIGTTLLIAVGTIMFWIDEPLGSERPSGERWMASVFQVMTASTTVGFNTMPIGELSHASVAMLIILMVIGASPSGTGGGLKTTTVTALWAVTASVVRRGPRTEFLGRQIPEARIRAAVAAALLYGSTLALAVWLLAMTWPTGAEPPLGDQIFELTSALGTVGLSRGITGDLSETGKVIVMIVMFVGRIGPLGLAFSVAARPRLSLSSEETRPARQEDVVV